MELLARADRHSDLTERPLTDVRARRRLNRSLREQGMEEALRNRARTGIRDALCILVRLPGETSRTQEAHRAVRDFGPEERYAHHIVARFPSPSNDAR